jgi:hypothetical protein
VISQEGTRLIYDIFVCLCIVVSNTYGVVCFCLRLVYLMLPVSLHCPFLIAPSVFSNVYLFMMIEFQLCKLIFTGALGG